MNPNKPGPNHLLHAPRDIGRRSAPGLAFPGPVAPRAQSAPPVQSPPRRRTPGTTLELRGVAEQ
jgi:hypothetical protein